MSLELGVVPSEAELSRAAVVALLGRLLGDDPDLHESVAAGEFAELLWEGDRISTQWFVHPGRTGVSELVVSIADAFPLQPARGFRAETARIVEVLQELAEATGGRFVVEEGDVTGTPLDEVLGAVFQRPTDADLPMWFGRNATLAPYTWSDDSLAVVDTVAFYAAECVRRAVPGLTWRVGHQKERGYVNEGQPVLAGHGRDLSPVNEMLTWLLGKVYALRNPAQAKPAAPPAGDDLREWFDGAVAVRRR